MSRRFRIFNWVFIIGVSGVLALDRTQARAQTLDEGWNALNTKYGAVRLRAQGFMKGTDPFDPNDPSQIEAIDLLAKTYTYGVYLKKLDTEAGKIKQEFDMFEKEVDGILKSRDRAALQPLAGVLSDGVGIHALEVLKLKEARPIHKLYNARVLDKIAELGHPALANTLIKILNDPEQNDGVHYYAIKAMETLLSLVQVQQAVPVLTKDQQAKCAEALVEFLEAVQKKAPSKNASQEEIDGFLFLRREAIRALAKIHTPVVNDKVRPALVLARFAGNDERIQPPPRIDERVEAAIGLARMDPGKDKQYQADYAAGQIGKCLGAFALAAQADRIDEKKAKDISTHPWRVLSAQLKDALETMKKNMGKNEYVAKVADRGTLFLNKTMAGSTPDANELTYWRSSQSDPPSKELFQGLPDSTVKPAPSDSEGTEK
jgi:HEAT repeat protein